MNAPLPMTDREWQDRLTRSRQALGNWTWEAGLPWADRKLMLGIAETEIAALKHYVPYMPVRMRDGVAPIIDAWDDLRLSLLE